MDWNVLACFIHEKLEEMQFLSSEFNNGANSEKYLHFFFQISTTVLFPIVKDPSLTLERMKIIKIA